MKDVDKMSDNELRSEVRILRARRAGLLSSYIESNRLLKLAKCPDDDCGGQGFTVVPDDHGEAMQQQCQWCDERARFQGDDDPTPWCHICGAMEQKDCDCAPYAENH